MSSSTRGEPIPCGLSPWTPLAARLSIRAISREFAIGPQWRGCPMYFKQFLHDETGCASYFLAARQSREAAVIDPQRDIQQYLDLAAERHYTIVDVIDTHLHADHVSGNRALAAATGARLWLHESADVLFPFNPLHDGQELHIGQ